MTQELESWILANIHEELESVLILIKECNIHLEQPVRLPLSTNKTETVKGVVKRTGVNLQCDAHIKMKSASFALKTTQELVQISLAAYELASAMAGLNVLDAAAPVDELQSYIDSIEKHLCTASDLLMSAPKYSLFPEEIRKVGPPGICADFHIVDYELVLSVHIYQDNATGHIAVDSVTVRAADPGLLAAGQHLKTVLTKVARIRNKLEALS